MAKHLEHGPEKHGHTDPGNDSAFGLLEQRRGKGDDLGHDFFLFINIIKATDNYGMNIIMTKYDAASRFLFIPWDLDATWGRTWLSERTSEEVVLTNNLFDRLITLNPDNFNQILVDRWEEFKRTLFDTQYINDKIEGYRVWLTVSGAIKRDSTLWPENELKLIWEVYYMQDWYALRLAYLNDYFNALSLL